MGVSVPVLISSPNKPIVGWLPPQWFNTAVEIEHRYNPDVLTDEQLGEIFSSSYSKGSVGVYTNQALLAYLLFTSTKWSLQLQSLFVLPAFRRQGAGSELLKFLQAAPITASYRAETCLIRESNRTGQQFLTKNGFRAVLLPGAFENEDGYMFSRPHKTSVGRAEAKLGNKVAKEF